MAGQKFPKLQGPYRDAPLAPVLETAISSLQHLARGKEPVSITIEDFTLFMTDYSALCFAQLDKMDHLGITTRYIMEKLKASRFKDSLTLILHSSYFREA